MHPPVLCVFLMAISACSTGETRVVEEEGGEATVISSAYTAQSAKEQAYEKARDYCEERASAPRVLRETSEVADGSMENPENLGSTDMAGMASPALDPEGRRQLLESHERAREQAEGAYRFTLEFRCEG